MCRCLLPRANLYSKGQKENYSAQIVLSCEINIKMLNLIGRCLVGRAILFLLAKFVLSWRNNMFCRILIAKANEPSPNSKLPNIRSRSTQSGWELSPLENSERKTEKASDWMKMGNRTSEERASEIAHRNEGARIFAKQIEWNERGHAAKQMTERMERALICMQIRAKWNWKAT